MQNMIARQVERGFSRFDRDGDGKLGRDEVPRNLRRFFERLDVDKDGKLSLEEAKGLGDVRRR